MNGTHCELYSPEISFFQMVQCVFDASWLYYYIQLSKQWLRSMFDMSSYRGYLRRAYGIMPNANNKEMESKDHNAEEKVGPNRRFFFTSPLDSLFGKRFSKHS